MNDELRKLMIMQIVNEEERSVAEFLSTVGLEFVAANSMFYDKTHMPTGEIDLIFTYQKAIFVIEVSTRADSQNRRKRRKKLCEWDTEEGRTKLAEKHELDKRHTMYMVYVDLSRDEIADDAMKCSDSNLKTIIVYKHELMPKDDQEGIKSAQAFLDLVIKKAENIKKNNSC